MFDLRIFLLAALVASPAAFRAAEGQLSVDEALTRLLIVMVGATVAALLVRTLWPLLAGTTTGEAIDAGPEALLAGADLGHGPSDLDGGFGGGLDSAFDSGFSSDSDVSYVDDGLDDLLNFDDVAVD